MSGWSEAVRVVRDALSEAARSPRLWLPALGLLLPTLALQLAFPGWLRSRLSPTMVTVVGGALLIAWVTQVASVGAAGWVHRQRLGTTADWRVSTSLALLAGTLVCMGLVAGLVPGLWLQARWAFAPLAGETQGLDALRASARGTRGRLVPLAVLAVTALMLSVLGQSLAAAVAEAAGTIVPVGASGGRTRFELRYLPHVLTSVLAWALAAFAVTVHAVGISQIAARTGASVGRGVGRPQPAWPGPARAVAWTSGLTLVALGLAAAAHKLQQHLH